MIVWLASYPRSGNTYFRVLLNSIFNIKTYSIYDDKYDIGADADTSKVVGHEFLPENFSLEQARTSEQLYYIKTHELLDNRVADEDKVIYLIRDGRESSLSFAKYQQQFGDKNATLNDILYGNSFIGSWGEHVTSWNPTARANTLLVKFEKLTKEPHKFIEALSSFLDINPINNKIPSFEELKSINPKFFRSGKINSWEKIYTQEEHFSFWLKNYKQMDEHGYSYKKPEKLDEILKEKAIEVEISRQNDYLISLAVQQKNEKQGYSNQKNLELEQLQTALSQKNTELTELLNIIAQLAQKPITTSPFAKYKAYKSLISFYVKLSNNE